jgi:predicted GIY-YIG superfamily endonuclease
MSARPVHVYELLDADGHSLYVGQTANVDRRVKAHRSKEWGWKIAKVETTSYPTRAEALEREKQLIRDRRPKYNLEYNHSGLRSSQVLDIIPGLTYRQLDYWCRKGHLTPIVAGGSGSGSRRVFDPDQVFELQRLVHSYALINAWASSGELIGRIRSGDVYVDVPADEIKGAAA